MAKLRIDLISEGVHNTEWVLYLVEDGPWSKKNLDRRLRAIQERIYNALDAVIDGDLAAAYPDSKYRKIRIQVDCHDNHPEKVEVLVRNMTDFIQQDAEYQEAIERSEFIDAIRIVTRTQMGRGGGAGRARKSKR